MKRLYRGNGKVLISGEYAVLDGALSLAAPTRFGQTLEVSTLSHPKLQWKSIDNRGQAWLTIEIGLPISLATMQGIDREEEVTLFKILSEANQLNPEFLSGTDGFTACSTLEFPRPWGLGSSSTLIHNIAQWAGIDPFELNRRTFGGSGYDIACAGQQGPILYRNEGGHHHIENIAFRPVFHDQLFFIWLNRKQDSREGIREYRKAGSQKSLLVERISQLSLDMSRAIDVESFSTAMEEHESIIASVLQTETVKQRLFADYRGTVKSLGAWGGDFVMACGGSDSPDYFRSKGYTTVLPFSGLLL